ncbi:MAG: type II toxin-antitoxin system HicA family toxin [Actinomycetota bacterium]|nr:type II toxin-antitoxin system HicA family toxin [Actinomycetota bacterium]
MAKLPVLTAKELIKLLKKIGFIEDRQTGSHLTLRRESDRKQVTVANHPSDTVPKGTLSRILKEIGLSVENLRKLK